MKDFLFTLGWLSLAGSVLGLAVLAVGRWSKGRLSRAFCCGLWVVVLLRLALPVAAPQALGGYAPFLALQRQLTAQAQVLSASVQETGTAEAPEAPPVRESFDAADAPQPSVPAQQAVRNSNQSQTALPPEFAAQDGLSADSSTAFLPQRQWTISLPQALFGIWAAGAVLRFAWKLTGYRRYRRQVLRSSAPAPQEARILFAGLYSGSRLRLVCSPAVHAALLLGVKDPVLVLPQQLPASLLTPAATAAALRHELTHYRRGDLWLKWAAELVCCLHWFNPLTALFRREIGRACELACDEAMIRTMNAAEKQAYGEMLIALAGRQHHTAVPLTAICEYKHQLKERLVSIMTYKKRNLLSVIACCCLLALLCGCAAALGPAEETPAAPAESTVTENAETTDKTKPEETTATTYPIPEYDATALRAQATVLTDGSIYNEYVRTETFEMTSGGEVDQLYNFSVALNGDRFWAIGVKVLSEEPYRSQRVLVSCGTDGSDPQALPLTAPTLDTDALGVLPEGHEWWESIDFLLDCGEEQPRILYAVTEYGPLDDGYVNALGGGAYYIYRFDETGVLTDGIPLGVQPEPGWFYTYLCATPGKLWFRLDQSLKIGEPGSLVSFSPEDGSLQDIIRLPEGASCLEGQGLADGRIVVQLADPYPIDKHSISYYSTSYRLVIADPETDTLSNPYLLPERFGIPFGILTTHALSDLPANPTLCGMYEWDLATNELHLTGSGFGNTTMLSAANIIPRLDGSFLILEHNSFRLMVAHPYPLEG